MHIAWAVAGASLLAWLFLLFLRGGFWRIRPLLDSASGAAPKACRLWPSVIAVIPARNEAAILGDALPTVLRQDYPGSFRVVLVDDRSDDGTANSARAAASAAKQEGRLTVIRGRPLETGWTGKVWAMAQGAAEKSAGAADYLWFTDADIAHDSSVLRALVEKAETDRLDLVSVMARLRVERGWDRLLIPAFVYFFAKLYPFRFVADPRRRTAGAAGGCMLVRRTTLERAGRLEAIRGALIDDCALGRLVKRSGGRIWLGFSRSVESIRVYGTLRSTWDMVARSAYIQLRQSPLLFLGTVLGMLFLYAVGPAAVAAGIVGACAGVAGSLTLLVLGLGSWVLPSISFVPMLRHHRVRVGMAVLLPCAAVLYVGMTLASAWRYANGRGGAWKGRVQGGASTVS